MKDLSTTIPLITSLPPLPIAKEAIANPIALRYLLAGVVLILLHRFIIYPLFLSPLARIPCAHPLAAFTPLWMDWQRFNHREFKTTVEAFKKCGPFVRLGPNEVAVNSMYGGVATAHGHGMENFDKTSWYDFFILYGKRNTFSTLGKEHGKMRKRITNVYAKAHVQTSRHFRAIHAELLQARFVPALWEAATNNDALDIRALNFGYGVDFMAAFVFGLSRGTDFTRDVAGRQSWEASYAKSHPSKYLFWLLEHPQLVKTLAKLHIHIVPQWFYEAQKEFEEWGGQRIDLTERSVQEGFTEEGSEAGELPHVYFQLKRAISEEKRLQKGAYFIPTPDERLELASECLDHMVATADTFGAAFSFVLHDLSKHPEAQARLRAELRSVGNPMLYPSNKIGIRDDAALPDPIALEKLPFLWAVIKESIRLRETVPTPNPRATPAGTMTDLGPYKNLPPGVRITAFAWAVNRNEEVFHEPERWLPDRWLDRSPQELAAMERGFWAFGSGSRQCLGRNVAMEIMRYVLAAIYTSFETSVADDSAFTTGTVGDKLMLQFSHVA